MTENIDTFITLDQVAYGLGVRPDVARGYIANENNPLPVKAQKGKSENTEVDIRNFVEWLRVEARNNPIEFSKEEKIEMIRKIDSIFREGYEQLQEAE